MGTFASSQTLPFPSRSVNGQPIGPVESRLSRELGGSHADMKKNELLKVADVNYVNRAKAPIELVVKILREHNKISQMEIFPSKRLIINEEIKKYKSEILHIQPTFIGYWDGENIISGGTKTSMVLYESRGGTISSGPRVPPHPAPPHQEPASALVSTPWPTRGRH